MPSWTALQGMIIHDRPDVVILTAELDAADARRASPAHDSADQGGFNLNFRVVLHHDVLVLRIVLSTLCHMSQNVAA